MIWGEEDPDFSYPNLNIKNFLKDEVKKFSIIDTIKKAREYPKGTLTDKELEDLGFKTYKFKTYPGMKSRDERILESREARKELEKLGKKAAKRVAIGGAVAGGLYLGKKIHDKQKEKKFSTAGREWAGFKGGMKGALKGAKWGAILAPGNLIAAGLGHPKTALGITAAGSLIGGGIGFKLGRDSGISEYKYKNNPEYKKKVDKEKTKEYLKDLKNLQESDEFASWDFNIKDWKDFSDSLGLPLEILKYIKFYESWRKNIKLWYSKALDGKDCDYWVAEFRAFFPIPMPAKIVKEWYETDKKYHSITFLTDNDAGDDGWVCYDLETKLYGWDRPNDTPSLKTLLQNHVERMKKIYKLSKEQENLVNKFLKSI